MPLSAEIRVGAGQRSKKASTRSSPAGTLEIECAIERQEQADTQDAEAAEVCAVCEFALDRATD